MNYAHFLHLTFLSLWISWILVRQGRWQHICHSLYKSSDQILVVFLAFKFIFMPATSQIRNLNVYDVLRARQPQINALWPQLGNHCYKGRQSWQPNCRATESSTVSNNVTQPPVHQEEVPVLPLNTTHLVTTDRGGMDMRVRKRTVWLQSTGPGHS